MDTADDASSRERHRLTRRAAVLLPVGGLVAAAGYSLMARPMRELPGVGKGLAVPVHDLWRRSAAEQGHDFALMRSWGVRWLRFDFYWDALESQRGVLDLAVQRAISERAVGQGLSLIGVVHTTPPWLRPQGSRHVHGPTGPQQAREFGRFCGEIAQHFRGLVTAWELWNEPNLVAFWQPAPDPGTYVQAVESAASAIASVDSEAIVLSGGLGGATASGDWTASDFFDAACGLGLLDHVGGVGVHPYPVLDGAEVGALQQVSEIRRILARRRRPDLRLWGTEMGVPTGGVRAKSDHDQAQLLSGAFQAWAQAGEVGPLCWYTLRDQPGGEGFGLLTSGDAPKTAVRALSGVRNR